MDDTKRVPGEETDSKVDLFDLHGKSVEDRKGRLEQELVDNTEYGLMVALNPKPRECTDIGQEEANSTNILEDQGELRRSDSPEVEVQEMVLVSNELPEEGKPGKMEFALKQPHEHRSGMSIDFLLALENFFKEHGVDVSHLYDIFAQGQIFVRELDDGFSLDGRKTIHDIAKASAWRAKMNGYLAGKTVEVPGVAEDSVAHVSLMEKLPGFIIDILLGICVGAVRKYFG